jgi:hypothetical protein
VHETKEYQYCGDNIVFMGLGPRDVRGWRKRFECLGQIWPEAGSASQASLKLIMVIAYLVWKHVRLWWFKEDLEFSEEIVIKLQVGMLQTSKQPLLSTHNNL